MTWNKNLPQVSNTLVQSPAIFQTNQNGVEGVLSNTNLVNLSPYIPPTAPVWFYTATATIPATWTGLALAGDSLLAVEGGTSQYMAAGGTTVGTWNGPPHALTIGEITNQAPVGASGSAFFVYRVGTAAAHSHDWTVTRPMANVGIICSKNP